MPEEYPINPHYDPEKAGFVRQVSIDPEEAYEFDTLAFWQSPTGAVYTASDSGCSCPTPFEAFEGYTHEEIVQKLERVPNFDAAEKIIDAYLGTFNDSYRKITGDKARLFKQQVEELFLMVA